MSIIIAKYDKRKVGSRKWKYNSKSKLKLKGWGRIREGVW
jgi:hypothetical protein